jgi:DNA-binding Xre family transcriptional regulator
MITQSRSPLPQSIKQAMVATGMSVNGLANQCGVAQAILQRFLAGKRGINLDTAERICSYLGLELCPAAGE